MRPSTKGLLICLALCLFGPGLRAQTAGDPGLQSTTEERVQSETWWPTRASAPLTSYAGSAACARCHASEASADHPSSMVRAAVVAADSGFLKGKASTSYTATPFTYSITATDAGLEYSVARGDKRLSRHLDWVMGAGDLGHTFLYQVDGHWFQSLATFYLEHAQLDLTTGLNRDPGGDLASALGVRLSADDTRRCFACHTVHSTTSQGFNPQHAEAGVGCEACHGPGGAHAANAKAPLFDPGKLSPADTNDFCGSCHRSSADVAAFTNDIVASSNAVVRFQPYRLEESKCWRATQDARLTCTACHDPHRPLNREDVSYDRNCLQCHAPGTTHTLNQHTARVCPKATSGCIQCHMPKVRVASMHGDFTDHFIRIARAGEGFPP